MTNCEVNSLMHLSVRFSNEAGMKSFLDFLYEKSQAGVSFTGLLEAMENEVTVVTAIHNIKSNAKARANHTHPIKFQSLQTKACTKGVYSEKQREKSTLGNPNNA